MGRGVPEMHEPLIQMTFKCPFEFWWCISFASDERFTVFIFQLKLKGEQSEQSSHSWTDNSPYENMLWIDEFSSKERNWFFVCAISSLRHRTGCNEGNRIDFANLRCHSQRGRIYERVCRIHWNEKQTKKWYSKQFSRHMSMRQMPNYNLWIMQSWCFCTKKNFNFMQTNALSSFLVNCIK